MYECYIIQFQDTVSLHKKFISECSNRLEVRFNDLDLLNLIWSVLVHGLLDFILVLCIHLI